MLEMLDHKLLGLQKWNWKRAEGGLAHTRRVGGDNLGPHFQKLFQYLHATTGEALHGSFVYET